MIGTAAVLAGTAQVVGTKIVEPDDHDIYDRLCDIANSLKAITTYNDRERQQSPYIAELMCQFNAGATVAGTRVDFLPHSSFLVETIILQATVNPTTLELRMGTRGPQFIVAGGGTPPLPLKYHLNAGQSVSIQDPTGAATVIVRGFLIGWYEHNRLGPVTVLGAD